MSSVIVPLASPRFIVNKKGQFFRFVNLSGRVCVEFFTGFVFGAINSPASVRACEWGGCK